MTDKKKITFILQRVGVCCVCMRVCACVCSVYVCNCVLCVISSLTQLTNFVLAVLALFKYRFSQRYDWVFQIWPQAKLRISHFNPPHSTPQHTISLPHTQLAPSLSRHSFRICRQRQLLFSVVFHLWRIFHFIKQPSSRQFMIQACSSRTRRRSWSCSWRWSWGRGWSWELEAVGGAAYQLLPLCGLAWPLDFLEIVRQTSERQRQQPSAV